MKLFYSNAEADRARRERLSKSLAALRQGGLEEWHDQLFLVGDDRMEVRHAQLESAALIAFLVSPDLLAMSYHEGEVARALERHRAGKARVVPILVRPVDLEQTPLGRLQFLPRDGRPVSGWRNEDRAWVDVARGISQAVSALRAKVPSLSSPDALLADGGEGTRVYLTSELFGFTKPWLAVLEAPAGTLLNQVIAALGLPSRLDHEGRIGLSCDYRLWHQGRMLARADALATQGVRKGDVLELSALVRSLAATDAVTQEGAWTRYRNPDDEEPALMNIGYDALRGIMERAGW